jgi:hypothetical protein
MRTGLAACRDGGARKFEDLFSGSAARKRRSRGKIEESSEFAPAPQRPACGYFPPFLFNSYLAPVDRLEALCLIHAVGWHWD